MNNYRFRLILGSASLTAAITVLALKLTGFLTPAVNPGELRLLATSQGTATEVSPWHLHCEQQIAMIAQTGQAGRALRILDPQGKTITCRATP